MQIQTNMRTKDKFSNISETDHSNSRINDIIGKSYHIKSMKYHTLEVLLHDYQKENANESDKNNSINDRLIECESKISNFDIMDRDMLRMIKKGIQVISVTFIVKICINNKSEILNILILSNLVHLTGYYEQNSANTISFYNTYHEGFVFSNS